MPSRVSLAWAVGVASATLCVAAVCASGQQPLPPPPPPSAPASAPAPTAARAEPAAKAPFKQEELDQMLAPVALYPDDLLSQVLMASTYPTEIVMADRWLKQNKSLQGDALATALEKQNWDPSVKSLVNVPPVLSMLSEKLDWTVKLGDAFLQDQKRLMDSVQALRKKAQAQGNLKSSDEQKVSVQQQVIVIEAADPQVIYVPTYDSSSVYGVWGYPAYPPYYYYPPGYVARPGVAFATGIAIGVAWGYAWGHCDWNHSDINIDINRNTNINNRIDRGRYQDRMGQGGRGEWKHDPAHRQGAPYRDLSTAQRLGGATGADQAARAREAYRGRTGGAGTNTALQRPSTAAGPNSGPRDRNGSRGDMSNSAALQRPSTAAGPNSGPRDRNDSRSMFGDMGNTGAAARAASNRGNASRTGSATPRPGRGGGGGRRR